MQAASSYSSRGMRNHRLIPGPHRLAESIKSIDKLQPQQAPAKDAALEIRALGRVSDKGLALGEQLLKWLRRKMTWFIEND